MLSQKLKNYLDENGIKYIVIKHSPAHSAQEIASLAHVPGREMAKTTIISVAGRLAMAVLPANYHINFARLASQLGHDAVYLADEIDFRDIFPDCELGAMPPFGNLYDMDVYVSESLAEDEEIVFNAGTHTECIRMTYKDFADLVQPRVFSFTDRKDAHPLHR